jgi:hypothetical protein
MDGTVTMGGHYDAAIGVLVWLKVVITNPRPCQGWTLHWLLVGGGHPLGPQSSAWQPLQVNVGSINHCS